MSALSRLVDRGSPSTSGSCTDMSEDSVEVRLQPISCPLSVTSSAAPQQLLIGCGSSNGSKRNKRKSSEPRKLKELCDDSRLSVWSSDEDADDAAAADLKPAKVSKTVRGHVVSSHQPAAPSEQPSQATTRNSISNEKGHFILNLPFDIRNILGPSAATLLSREDDEPEDEEDDDDEAGSRSNQRNYKSMTRERRIEANARERTRVHTISAAFENLRRAVPSYSCHQKLSKLAILRIACSYILALANLNDLDYSCEAGGGSSSSRTPSKGRRQGQLPSCVVVEDDGSQSAPSTFAQCVDLCTKTIQLEGKVRKRKG